LVPRHEFEALAKKHHSECTQDTPKPESSARFLTPEWWSFQGPDNLGKPRLLRILRPTIYLHSVELEPGETLTLLPACSQPRYQLWRLLCMRSNQLKRYRRPSDELSWRSPDCIRAKIAGTRKPHKRPPPRTRRLLAKSRRSDSRNLTHLPPVVPRSNIVTKALIRYC